jgi:hypothetical protein
MKSPRRRSLVPLAVLAAVAVLVAAETLIVKVQTTALRSEPKFYAPVIATLRAGAQLQQLQAQGDWLKVQVVGGQAGWVHKSAVETKKFNLLASGGGAKTQASAGEVALAAKGFNKQVEDSYKAKHGEANFAAVDAMLKVKATPEEVEAFLKRGKLGEFGGGR